MRRPKYFTPNEVSVHNTLNDIWVSYLGKVYDLTPLLEEYKGDVLLKPITECAGKDISHWFDPKTKDILTHVDPLTGCIKYYTPRGRFLHISPPCPRTDWPNDFGKPWWKDNRYEVCSEETLDEILQRYLRYNSHAASYTWKHNGVNLDMSKTLSENGIPAEDELYCGSPDCDLFSPSICLYFNDDLTEL
ncbi:cytochrome b5 domain-containing protein 1 isoform X2 [Carassius carassius]|uniref:cytochrome b5 domain-containing protein 1 isoform X2 n=1 Tax=Carassius carassius TaxID=217509 RepID=UPI0028697FAE|nr:cytochrome b5 domain-containing protein 1 isoform X2 [Carassius carassius]